MRELVVSAEELQAGDKLENGATISRAWVGTNRSYVLYESVSGGVRTTYRHRKFSIKRPETYKVEQ